MSGRITALFRYPIKGLTGEVLQSVHLVVGQGFPGDRIIAVARTPTVFDPVKALPVAKQHFLMLCRDAALVRLNVRYQDATQRVAVESEGVLRLEVSLGEAEGRRQFEAFLKDYLGGSAQLQPRVVQAEGHLFTNVNEMSPEMMRSISLINMNSVRALEETLQREVDLRRFRANIYFDGFPAWSELDWIDQTIVCGGVRMKIVMRTDRCAATEVNPDTAERDIRLPLEMKKRLGHFAMGVYAVLLDGGVLNVGDSVHGPEPT